MGLNRPSFLLVKKFQSLFTDRFKGYAAIDGIPEIEVLYFLPEGKPQLKVGFAFRDQYLHKVVHMFYGDDKIKSTWMKFGMICKYKSTLSSQH